MKEINFTIKEKAGTQAYTISYISAAGMPRTRSFETMDEAIQNQGYLRQKGIISSLQINFSAAMINGSKVIETSEVSPPPVEEDGRRPDTNRFYKPNGHFMGEVKGSPNYSTIDIKH